MDEYNDGSCVCIAASGAVTGVASYIVLTNGLSEPRSVVLQGLRLNASSLGYFLGETGV